MKMKATLIICLLFATSCTSRGSSDYPPVNTEPYWYHQGANGEMKYRPLDKPYWYWERAPRNTPAYLYDPMEGG